MNLRILVCALPIGLALNSPGASGQEWPKLVNGKKSAECQAAMRLAAWAHQSNNFTLWAPPAIPDDFGSTLVLGPQGIDLSGGDALNVDATIFTKVPLPEYSARSLYWQTEADKDERIVIEEIPHGWRGDAYAVRSIDKLLSTTDYVAVRNDERNTKFPTVFSGAWRAPLIFRKDGGRALWIIHVGEPYVFSPNWLVYASDSIRTKPTCEIRFRPDVEDASFLLPRPVQKLGILLNQSIGSGQEEGTLQPTARIRIDVQQAWANAALRPWAKSEPYNSREEVDENLSRWARQNLAYRKTYASIGEQYPLAERALRNYYRQKFHMPVSTAEFTAKTVLDAVFRTHYVFPREHN